MATAAMNHAQPSSEPASSVALASTVCVQNGAGALRVLQHVRPCWDLSLVQFKTFTDGITNQLVGCWQGGGELGGGGAAAAHLWPEDRALHRQGPSHIQADSTDTSTHALCEVTQGGGQVAPSLFPTLHKYLRLVPTHFNDIEKNLRFVSCIPSKAELELEVSLLEEHLSGLGSPVVFCHNDLLVKNIIYQEKQGRVIFIDFEYADNNYQALDIGNHFCEFGGVERFDSSLYPDREFQLCWLQHYLDEWHRLAGRGECASSRDVEVLYVQVNKFALASCMLWCLWALIQAAHSTIKFDFIQFALERLDMYKRHKAEFIDLKLPPS
ncbi:hypothetical protein MRX96_017197 [Rhipicephalus microplus]